MDTPKIKQPAAAIITPELDFYNAFMQSPVAICILKGKDHCIEFANDLYLQMLGKEKDIIGKPILESFPELKAQGTIAIIDDTIKNGKTKHIDEREVYIITNGEKEQRFFNCDYQPLKEKDGTNAGIIIVFTEVTVQVLERKRTSANQQLLTAELGEAHEKISLQKEEKEKQAVELTIANKELLLQNDEKEKKVAELRVVNYARSLIEASLDPLFTISPEGKITDMNNASVNIIGVSRKDLIGTNFFDYFTEPEKAKEVYQQVFANGFVADYPLTITDHKLTDVLFNGSVYKDEQSNILGVVVVARDMTEQKKFEKSLEKSLKEISDYKYALDESSIVSITDQKGIIKYANDNFCKISKYPCSELIGQDHRIINSGYHSKEFIHNLWTTIANGKIWKGELRNKAKDQTIYWVDTTIVPFLDEVGMPYQYIVIRTDITKQKKN